jgi:hypothetical protein
MAEILPHAPIPRTCVQLELQFCDGFGRKMLSGQRLNQGFLTYPQGFTSKIGLKLTFLRHKTSTFSALKHVVLSARLLPPTKAPIRCKRLPRNFSHHFMSVAL